MKIKTKILGIVSFAVLLSSCATIVSKSNWPLTVNTNPSGAKIEITNSKGIAIYSGITPATLKLASGAGFFAKQSYKIKLTLDGYAEKIIPVECTLNGWYIGNLVFGGLIGFLIVDPASGAMYKLDTEYISESLVKVTAQTDPSLNILDINKISPSMKNHLVALNK